MQTATEKQTKIYYQFYKLKYESALYYLIGCPVCFVSSSVILSPSSLIETTLLKIKRNL